MKKTKIQWADRVWNPVSGYDQDEPFRVKRHPDKLDEPSRIRKPQNVFVCSMGDLFHKDVTDAQLDSIMSIMEQHSRNNYMILTKRAERMQYYVNDYKDLNSDYWNGLAYELPLNIWLGVTAENQQRADERIPYLIATGHENLFVSLEPLLEAVNITPYLDDIKGVIIGAESGSGRRECRLEWVQNLIYKCKVKGVPVFYKQGLNDAGEWVKDPEVWGEKWLQFPEGLKLEGGQE